MRLWEKILIAAVTAGPLVAVLAGSPLLGPDTGDLNRDPLPFPDLAAADALDAATYGEVGAWLRDRVPLRRQVRAIDTRIDRGLFGDIDDAMILQGRDGWLYFEPAIANGLAPGFEPEAVREGILGLKSQVEAAGKTFLFAFAPHKPTVYPQYLSERDARRQDRVRARLDEFRELMRREPVGGFIDAWSDLEAAARTAPEPLYYPRDTHWTPLGAVALTRRIVATLDPGLDTALEASRGKPRKYVPDLARYAGLDTTETIRPWSFRRPGIRVQKAGVEKGAKTAAYQYRARRKGRSDATLLPKIAVICDSYGTSMRPSLSQYFATTTFIHVQSGLTALATKAIAEADIVLFVRVERFLWQTTADMPFAADSAEVLELLSTLRPGRRPARSSGLTPPRGPARASAAVTRATTSPPSPQLPEREESL
ncbi:alginate O-acetyltransferase AlgX-related protein [Microbaculum marinum]|uniref:AlgX/AlgJ SGNH hydrolase-like domain-containing protein n=1 Tax=Microbaculum marinum TaxID=1764581 RepID=A0AAW9RN24_9HYPH